TNTKAGVTKVTATANGSSKSVDTTFEFGPNFGAGCTQGLVTAGGLTYTCAMSSEVANANGISSSGSVQVNGVWYILHSWKSANAYCTNLGGRLPTLDELKALHNTLGDMKRYGWPTSSGYWSSTQSRPGYHYGLQLSGGLDYDTIDSYGSFVTCVR
ncbi:adhesion domain-containing protein, partial [Aeromonas veronii]